MKVNNEANVCFVDTHAEGDGGHDNTSLIAHKSILDGAAIGQARMVRFGLNTGIAQLESQRLTLVAAIHIDNAAAWCFCHKFEQAG